MAPATKKKKAVKTKKKKWFPIIAPPLFSEQVIGESPCTEPQHLVGKKLTMNMMKLTNDPRNQGMSVTFTVNEMDGEQGKAALTGYQIVPATIKRMVRRGKDRIDLSALKTTKDGKYISIKPMVLTKSNASGGIKKSLRQELSRYVNEYVGSHSFEAIQKDVIQNKLQKELFNRLKKFYPIAICKIRAFQLLADTGAGEAADTQAEQEEQETASEENTQAEASQTEE